jgi:protein-L-isoaspartate(D-aspartate) O-methyltransferase
MPRRTRPARKSLFWPFLALGACLAAAGSAAGGNPSGRAEDETFYIRLRQKMVAEQLAARDITDRKVLAAMRKVPRHLFVPPELRSRAYEDYPLPIGGGQTISQPYIVALMTQWAAVGKGDRVLEVGTGSGYQAAVLAELVDRVFSVEIDKDLAGQAAGRLRELGFANVEVKWGDGYQGWEDKAPFDAILVTCAAPFLPPALFRQLKEGGRLVMPLEKAGSVQVLTLIEKKGGQPLLKPILDVRFVPMRGEVETIKAPRP